MSGPSRLTRGLAIFLMGLPYPLCAAHTPGVERRARPDVDALAETLDALAGEDEDAREAARARLDELGAGVIPDFLALASGSARPTGDRPRAASLPAVYADVARILSAKSSERIVAETLRSAGGAAGFTTRLEAVRLLGATCDASALPAMFDLLEAQPASALRHPRIADVVADALATVLERDPRGHGTLGAELARIPASLMPAACKGIGSVRGPRGVTLLGRMTGKGLDRAVLEAVGEWEPWSAEALDGTCGDLARSFLAADDHELRRAAARALGRLRDSSSVDALVEMLGEHDPRIRRSAHWALCRITGRTWSAEVARWRRWRAAEAAWLGERSAALASALDADTAQAVAALRELAAHGPLEPDLFDAVLAALRDRRVPVAVAAATALANLGDPAAAASLIEATDERRVPVSNAARAALARITGRSAAGMTSADWRAALGLQSTR